MTAGTYVSQMPQAPVLLGTELVPTITVGAISGITQATFAVVTLSNPSSVNPFTVGQTVFFAGVGGMTQINGVGNITITGVGGTSGAWTLTLNISSSGFSAYTSGGECTANAYSLTAKFQLSAAGSPFNPTFLSGGLQYAGPNGLLTGNNNFIVGTLIPNPSGTPGPCALWGSGGGSGANVSFWHITDEAFDTASPGNDVGFTAGEVQPGSSQRGGNTWKIAGAADLGTGGTDTDQGGTSARGPGGMKITVGGNNTDGNHPPGDNFMIAGEAGSQGANVHIAATVIGGIPGVIHIGRFNSTFVLDLFLDGSQYAYASNGFGSPMAPWISRGAGAPAGWATPSTEVATGTVPLAKITSGGANGSLTVVNGLITAITNPT